MPCNYEHASTTLDDILRVTMSGSGDGHDYDASCTKMYL